MSITKLSQAFAPSEISPTSPGLSTNELEIVHETNKVLHELRTRTKLGKIKSLELCLRVRRDQVKAFKSLLEKPEAYRSYDHWQRRLPAVFFPEGEASIRDFFQARFGASLLHKSTVHLTMKDHLFWAARDIEKLQSFSVDYDQGAFEYRSKFMSHVDKPSPMKHVEKASPMKEDRGALERVLPAVVKVNLTRMDCIGKLEGLKVKWTALVKNTEYEDVGRLHSLAVIAFDLFEFSILAVRDAQLEKVVQFIEGSHFALTYSHILAHFGKGEEERKEEAKEPPSKS